MHRLIEELKQYHSEKAHYLSELGKCVNSIIEDSYPKDSYRELQQLFQPFQHQAELLHHHNEELILRELRATSAPIHRRVEEISADHTELDRIVANIACEIENESMHYREVCANIHNFIRIYDDHASGEEAIFFPISEQYLEQRHWLKISRAWK